jgi:hypothetical protein
LRSRVYGLRRRKEETAGMRRGVLARSFRCTTGVFTWQWLPQTYSQDAT